MSGEIKNILAAIIRLQEDYKNEDGSDTSNLFLKSLKKDAPFVNTVPLILYDSTFKPVKATGVTSSLLDGEENFLAIETFIFKIHTIKENYGLFELLVMKLSSQADVLSFSTPAEQLNCGCITDLIGTDLYFHVDLVTLAAVSCLPAVWID